MRKRMSGRRQQPTAEEADEIRKLFGLSELPNPKDLPHDTGIGLTEVEELSEAEIIKIAAAATAALMPHWNWYIGDVCRWIRANPHSPTSKFVFSKLLVEFKESTIMNYRGVADIYPSSKRVSELSLAMHDAVRTAPAQRRRELLLQALKEGISEKALRRMWRNEQLRNQRPNLVEGIFDEIKRGSHHFYKLAQKDPSGSATRRAFERCAASMTKLRRVLRAQKRS